MQDFTWMTGGKQGSGIDSAQEIFSKLMIRYGYNTFGYREYFSNIKGMHSFFIVRISDKKINSFKSTVELAVFFDKESVFGEKNLHGEVIHEGHLKDITKGGTLIIDKSIDKTQIKRDDINIVEVDFDSIIKVTAEKLNKKLSDLEITKNVIAVASSAFLLGIDEKEILEAIKSSFKNKSDDIINTNLEVAKSTFEAMHAYKPIMLLHKLPNDKSKIFLDGTEATAIGKTIAGCKLQVYYPITPASDESTFLEAHPELGIRVVQPENEIAVASMITGASMSGIRAATSTSGPGFSLMTEVISYAGMTETPIVIIDHQRGAPSTGLPTRTEQADLLFAAHQGHGDFNRIVLSPGTIEQLIEITALAFNYAEMYQLPVIVLNDKGLAQATTSMEEEFIFNFKNNYRINRGLLIEHDLSKGEYKRYLFTQDGISPRIKLGDKNAVMYVAGDEHDEYGHILEEPNNRVKMMEKRNNKDKLILSQLSQDEKYILYNDPEKTDLLIVTWGSTTGSILDILDDSIALLQIKLIVPFPVETIDIIKKAKKVVIAEQNVSGQLMQYIASQTGFKIENMILKYNGRPTRSDEIKEAIEKIKAGEKKVILNGY